MPLWIQAKIMCSESKKAHCVFCFKYQISCTVQMLGSLPSLHRLQNGIAGKKLPHGQASLSACTQIVPHFYLALDSNFFYTIIFNEIFLKEIILIIKRATLQAGLREIIFQFFHSFPFTNTFGLRGRGVLPPKGQLRVAPWQLSVPLGRNQTNLFNV